MVLVKYNLSITVYLYKNSTTEKQIWGWDFFSNTQDKSSFLLLKQIYFKYLLSLSGRTESQYLKQLFLNLLCDAIVISGPHEIHVEKKTWTAASAHTLKRKELSNQLPMPTTRKHT